MALIPYGAAAQTCPDQAVCTYVFPLPPCPPASIGDPRTCGGTLLFAAGENAASIAYSLAGVAQPPLGLGAGEAAFIHLQPTSTATAFDRVESRGAVAQSYNGAALMMQSETTVGAQCAAVLPNHFASLGTDFRLAGFALDQSNGDDTGFDYAAIFAPQDCNVVAEAPTAAYSRLQANAPGSRFWHSAVGPEVHLQMPAGSSILLRTQGAGHVVGAHGFPIDGARITSDAPIAVAAGSRGCLVDAQNMVWGCEDAFEGVVPIRRLGRNYVVGQFSGFNGQQVRIVADTPGTEVRCNGDLVAVLDAGETHIFVPAGVTNIETSANVLVLQSAGLFPTGGDFALVQPMVADTGQPMQVGFALFTDDEGILFTVLPTSALPSLRFDAVCLVEMGDANILSVPGHADWSAVMLPQIGAGEHLVTADSTMLVSLMVGNLNSGSGSFSYATRLRRPGCGDGIVDAAEACDDGNLADFDGCTSMCDVAEGYSCTGEPSVCTLVQAPAVPVSPAPASLPEPAVTDLSCALSGCPVGQYCGPTGCLPQRNNARLCVADTECLGQVCASDGRCGLEDGTACVDAASCRSAVCDQGVCVDLGARAAGDGLSSCAMLARRGAPGRRDAQALGVLALTWALARHVRRRRLVTAGTGGRSPPAAPSCRRPATPRRGRRRLALWRGGCGLLLLWAQSRAQVARAAEAEGGLNLLPLPAQQSGAPWLVVDGFAAPAGDLNMRSAAATVALRLGGAYAPRPLVVRHSGGAGILGTVIAHQTTLRATATAWWRDTLRLSLSLPVQVYAAGGSVPGSPVAFAAPRHAVAAGDLVVAAAWAFWQAPNGLLRTVAAASLTLPTGSPAAYAADGTVAGGLRLAAVGRRGPWDYAASFAGQGRSKAMVAGMPLGPFTLLATAAVGHYFYGDVLHVGLEVPLSTLLRPGTKAFAARTSWIDPTLSLRYAPDTAWAYMLGASTSLVAGPGETRWRILAAVDVAAWAARQVPADAQAAATLAPPLAPVQGASAPTEPTPMVPSPAAAATALDHVVPPSPALPPELAARREPALSPAPPLSSDVVAPAEADAPPAPVVPPPDSAALLPYRVQFAAKRADVARISTKTLVQVQQFLKTAAPHTRLHIVGFTDISGSADYNMALSLRRAQAVYQALVAMGVPAARLQVAGLGAQRFIADNETADGRQANRRVEFFADENDD